MKQVTLKGMLEFTAGCEELYDVQFLPGKLRPMILNEDTEATREAFTNPESSYWLRPNKEITEGDVTAGENKDDSPSAGTPTAQPSSATSQRGTTVATPDSPSANTTTVEATIGGTVPTKLFLRVVATQSP